MTMTDVFRPPLESVGNPLERLSRALDARRTEIAKRRAMESLLDLDDHRLDDLGITRADIRSAATTPLSVDASTELHRLALLAHRLHV